MKNKYRVRSFKNVCYSALSQIVTILIGLILPRLYLVNYGSEINGLLNSTNQFLVYLSLFEAGIGAVTLQALYKPVAESDKDSVNAILAATNQYYKKAGVYYLGGLILLSVAYPFLADSSLSFGQVFTIVFFSGFSNVILFFFQGKYNILLQAEGKKYILTSLTSIINILVGVGKLVLILLDFSPVTIIVVSCIIRLVQAVYIVYYIKKEYKWIDLNVTPNNNAICQRNYTLIHQFAGMIFQNTDLLILTVFCDLKVVSIYSIYKLVTTELESLLTILSDGTNFALGQLFQTSIERYKQMIDVFASLYSAVAFALFSVALGLYLPFVQLYTDGVSDAEYVSPYLPVLFVSISLLTVIRTPMLYTINYAGHFKLTTPQTVIETVINLVVSLICVKFFGIYGVLIGTVVALLYRSNDIILYSNIKILKRSPLKTYCIYLLCIGTLVVLQFLYLLIPLEANTWMMFGVIGILYTVISLVAMFSVQAAVFPQHIKILLRFIKHR